MKFTSLITGPGELLSLDVSPVNNSDSDLISGRWFLVY